MFVVALFVIQNFAHNPLLVEISNYRKLFLYHLLQKLKSLFATRKVRETWDRYPLVCLIKAYILYLVTCDLQYNKSLQFAHVEQRQRIQSSTSKQF